MNRLVATLAHDVRLQSRSAVYVIVGAATVLLAAPLRAVFTPDQLRFFMPLVALSGVTITTFLLIGVLLMLERGEGMLDVVLVSPLRPGEYLASKLLTLVGLALVEGLAIVFIAYGLDTTLGLIVLAIALRAGLVGAIGIAVGVRYRSLTAYLPPAVGWAILFDVPALWYLGIWPGPLAYVWPTLPSLLVSKAAFTSVSPTMLAYALVYGLCAMAAALVWARRSLERFVVRGELPA